MSIYTDNLEFKMVQPGCCNVPFMMTENQHRRLIESHETWWCPSCGSSRHYTGKSEQQKLEERLQHKESQLDSERRQRAHAEQQERFAKNQVRAQKGAKTKLMKRIHNGVCPCCTRTFANLQRHMKSQHPDYTDDGQQAEVITFKKLREDLGLSQSDVADECSTKSPYVSMYERGKPCPADARESIESWFNKKQKVKI